MISSVDELSEEEIEKSLRSAGGAHQPTSFKFSGVLPAELPPQSPTAVNAEPNVPRSPGGSRLFTAAWNLQNAAFHARNYDAISREYAPEAKLIITQPKTGLTASYEGVESIRDAFKEFFQSFSDEYEIVKVEKMQPDPEHGSEGIVYSYWTTNMGLGFGSETLVFVQGYVVVHTILVYAVVDDDNEEDERTDGDFEEVSNAEAVSTSATAGVTEVADFREDNSQFQDSQGGAELGEGGSYEESIEGSLKVEGHSSYEGSVEGSKVDDSVE